MLAESQSTTGPATVPAAETEMGELGVLAPLLIVGTVLLVVWIVRHAKSPGTLALRDAPPRPNRLTPLHVFVAFVACFLLQAPAAMPTVQNYAYGELLVAVFSQVGWLTATLLAAAWAFPQGLRGGFGLTLRHGRRDAWQAVLTLLTVLPAVMGLLLVSGLLVDWAVHHGLMAPESDRRHAMLDRLQTVGMLGQALIILSAVVLAPLAEELFFRGLLQSLLRNFMSPWAAIVISSFLFALMHFAVIRSVPPLLLFGLVLGYTYEHRGRLLAPIAIHALFNAAMLAATLAA